MVNSKIILTGIITDVDKNHEMLGISRPMIKLTTYSTVSNTWIDNITAVFTDRGMVSSMKNTNFFNVHDIVLVMGEIFYEPNVGYIIYVNSWQFLRKCSESSNIDDKLGKIKILLTTEIMPQNFVYIKGVLCAGRDDFATIQYKPPLMIRGKENTLSTIPLELSTSTKEQFKKKGIDIGKHKGSECTFIGSLNDKYLRGDLLLVK